MGDKIPAWENAASKLAREKNNNNKKMVKGRGKERSGVANPIGFRSVGLSDGFIAIINFTARVEL